MSEERSRAIHSKITVTARLDLDESELRALDALAGYGSEQFLAVFYKCLGKSYLEPHEEGLKRLFMRIRNEVPRALSKVEMARKFLKEND